MDFNLADLFEAVADAVPDRAAIRCDDEVLTYRELDERANRFAAVLVDVGVGPGDHVGLQLLNSHVYVEAMLGAFKHRAVPVNVNHRYLADELAYLYDNARLEVLVHDHRFGDAVAGALKASPTSSPPHVLVVGPGSDGGYEAALGAASPARPTASRSGDDRYVIYTGGTTGLPKGVVWRHEDLFFGALGGGDRLQQGDVIRRPEELVERIGEHPVATLVCAPLMHGNAQWTTLGTFFAGGTVVLTPDGRLGRAELATAIGRQQVNVISLVGDAMARPLLDAVDAEEIETGSVFAVASGGAILSPTTKQRLAARFPNAVIVDGVGSSEAGVLGQRAYGGDGDDGPPRFAVNASTAVFDDSGTPIPPGSPLVGQLARSGHLPIGYHADAAKTEATFRTIDGTRWVLTGDAATVEEDGTIRLLGRGSVSINTGGEKVYPEEVEAVLKGHPDVLDAVVVGVPDDRWGERVVAVVEPVAGRAPTLEQLQELARSRLAAFKAPKDLVLVDGVVRSPAGKPDYRWARATAIGDVGQ